MADHRHLPKCHLLEQIATEVHEITRKNIALNGSISVCLRGQLSAFNDSHKVCAMLHTRQSIICIYMFLIDENHC